MFFPLNLIYHGVCEDLDLEVNHWRVQTVYLSTSLILIPIYLGSAEIGLNLVLMDTNLVLVWVLFFSIMMTAVVTVSVELLVHMDTEGTADVAALVEDLSLPAVVHDLFKSVLVCMLTERLQHSSVC